MRCARRLPLQEELLCTLLLTLPKGGDAHTGGATTGTVLPLVPLTGGDEGAVALGRSADATWSPLLFHQQLRQGKRRVHQKPVSPGRSVAGVNVQMPGSRLVRRQPWRVGVVAQDRVQQVGSGGDRWRSKDGVEGLRCGLQRREISGGNGRVWLRKAPQQSS